MLAAEPENRFAPGMRLGRPAVVWPPGTGALAVSAVCSTSPATAARALALDGRLARNQSDRAAAGAVAVIEPLAG